MHIHVVRSSITSERGKNMSINNYGIWVTCRGPILGLQEAWAKDAEGYVYAFETEELAQRKADKVTERRRLLSACGPSITYTVKSF